MSPIEAESCIDKGPNHWKQVALAQLIIPIVTLCLCHYQFVVAIVLHGNNGLRRCWVNKKRPKVPLDVDFTDDLPHDFYLKCELNQSISIQVRNGIPLKKRLIWCEWGYVVMNLSPPELLVMTLPNRHVACHVFLLNTHPMVEEDLHSQSKKSCIGFCIGKTFLHLIRFV